MKPFFLLLLLAAAVAACNNTTENNFSADSTSSPDNGHDGSHTAGDTTHAQTGGGDMMQMMHKNMEDMKAIPSTGDADHDFAALMKVHHAAAVEMANDVVAKGTNAEMKKMAETIISDQQKEIAAFDAFLSTHKPKGGNEAFYNKAMQQMTDMKMDMSGTGSLEKQFVVMMIPHHQGAIDMAKAYLESGATDEKLKTMANNIITSQQKEIVMFQNWLSRNG